MGCRIIGRGRRHDSRDVSPNALARWLVVGLLVAVATAATATPGSIWATVARETAALLDQAAKAAQAGRVEQAKALVSDAYFGVFEERGMEIAIRQEISARRARELERMFGAVREAIAGGEPEDRLRHRITALREALVADAGELDRLGVPRPEFTDRDDPRAPATAAAPGGTGSDTPPAVLATLDEAAARYRAGDRAAAQSTLDSAYFDQLEGAGLETAIGARWPERKAAIETGFARVRRAIAARAPADEVAREVELLKAQIHEAVALLAHRSTPWTALLNSTLIIVREGFEAILVITALVAYLLKSGHADKVRVVYQASGLALLGSLLTAVLIQTLFRVNPRHQETLEGATMLLAMAVLFYVSYWLTSKAEADRWQQYIRKKVQASLSRGSLVALWSAAFLAVYREGAETVLFYQALLAGADPGEAGAIFAGLGAGAIALVLIFLVLRSSAVRIPVRAFFAATSALLYYLALVFAGKGIRELQMSGVVGITSASWLPTWEPLGLYPTWESLGLQILLVGAAAFALSYLFLIRGKRARADSTIASVRRGGIP